MNNTSIQNFIYRLEQSHQHAFAVDRLLQDLHDWRSQFGYALQQHLQVVGGFQLESPLQKLQLEMNQQLELHMQGWDAQWAALAPAQSLAEAFDDKVMLLVFGKFNAGKSSLCNLLADSFRLQQQAVKYFHLENGQVVYRLAPLREGATETTARLQGVCLGEKLILLDTPGLHSVTAENAALTQRFIDSADGVLWLSSSSSPGQVQELDALGRELRRHKPLLPILTRSDQVEEDEVDGEICSVLCNKNASQRALQEADVYQRSKDKLQEMAVDHQLLRTPVSISAQMVRQADFDQQAMTEAGVDQLFHALLDLIEPALNYKQRKPAEIFIHYLQEHILEPIQHILKQMLAQIAQLSSDMQTALPVLQEKVIANTWRHVVPELGTLLAQHAATQDVDIVCKTLENWANEALSQQLAEHLTDYALPNLAPVTLNLAAHIRYEVIAAHRSTDEPTIAYDQLHAELSNQLQQSLSQPLAPLFAECTAYLNALDHSLQQRREMLMQFTQTLDQTAQQMRTGQ